MDDVLHTVMAAIISSICIVLQVRQHASNTIATELLRGSALLLLQGLCTMF